MSENTSSKSKIIYNKDPETISWLKEEISPADGGREEDTKEKPSKKTKERLSVKHESPPPPSPSTGDESFQEPSRKKNIRLVTYTSRGECSKILTYKEAKEISSHQSDNEGECASLVLACLFCHFCDFLLMLPNVCENLVTSVCCPFHRYYHTSDEDKPSNDCNCNCDCDCGLFDICQESGDCLEFAMEISEVCYH